LYTDRVSSLLSFFQNRDFIVYNYEYQAALEGQFGEGFEKETFTIGSALFSPLTDNYKCG
jgi:hypothetical protein